MREFTKDGYQVHRMGLWSPGPGCHGGCGAEVYVKDGKVAKVEGNPEHPYHQGRLCPRALAMYCDLCGARTAKGEQPACVKHCQASTMVYGDVVELAKLMEDRPRCVLFAPW